MLEPYQPAYCAPPTARPTTIPPATIGTIADPMQPTATALQLHADLDRPTMTLIRPKRIDSLNSFRNNFREGYKDAYRYWGIPSKSVASGLGGMGLSGMWGGIGQSTIGIGLGSFGGSGLTGSGFREYRRASSGSTLGLGLAGDDNDLLGGSRGNTSCLTSGNTGLTGSRSNVNLAGSAALFPRHHHSQQNINNSTNIMALNNNESNSINVTDIAKSTMSLGQQESNNTETKRSTNNNMKISEPIACSSSKSTTLISAQQYNPSFPSISPMTSTSRDVEVHPEPCNITNTSITITTTDDDDEFDDNYSNNSINSHHNSAMDIYCRGTIIGDNCANCGGGINLLVGSASGISSAGVYGGVGGSSNSSNNTTPSVYKKRFEFSCRDGVNAGNVCSAGGHCVGYDCGNRQSPQSPSHHQHLYHHQQHQQYNTSDNSDHSDFGLRPLASQIKVRSAVDLVTLVMQDKRHFL